MRYEEKCSCNATIIIQTEGFNTYELAQVVEKWREDHKHEALSPVGGVENGSNEESTEN